jgi:Domain of unknown function (DUF4349)
MRWQSAAAGLRRYTIAWAILPALGLALFLASCGGSNGVAGSTAGGAASHSTAGQTSPQQGAVYATPAPGQVANTGTGSGQGQTATTGLYLIKSLEADMSVPDPRVTAGDLRQWIAATDPKAQSAGIDYERQNDGTYSVQLTYSIQAAIYPQVQSYLAGYAADHHGHLDRLHENVQDVTAEYVDLQSQLTNLRAEQQRLLDLLAHSNNLGDTLQIEQRLTDVEGQIEQIEGRQRELNGQTTFYMVTINLSPLSGGAGSPPPSPWDPRGIVHAAWGAAVAFGEWLASVAIWLAVFGIYLAPAALIAWLVWRRVRHRKPSVTTR